MRKFILNISIISLMFAYLGSNVGFATHECNEADVLEVLSLLEDISCEGVHPNTHPHNHNQGACDGHHHSECSGESETPCECAHTDSDSNTSTDCDCSSFSGNCCEIETYYLSDAQTVKASEQKKVLIDEPILILQSNDIQSNSHHYASIAISAPPLIITGRERNVLISTWRL